MFLNKYFLNHLQVMVLTSSGSLSENTAENQKYSERLWGSNSEVGFSAHVPFCSQCIITALLSRVSYTQMIWQAHVNVLNFLLIYMKYLQLRNNKQISKIAFYVSQLKHNSFKILNIHKIFLDMKHYANIKNGLFQMFSFTRGVR